MNDLALQALKKLDLKYSYQISAVDKWDGYSLFYSLWHYTSLDGLLGITKEPEKMHFWFTRSDYLNDPSEGNYVLDLFDKIRRYLLENGKISKEFDTLLQDISIPEKQLIKYPSDNTNTTSVRVLSPSQKYSHVITFALVSCHTFICSFSTKEDSLDLWRYYSKGNGGYALNFCYPTLFQEKEDFGLNRNKDEEFSQIKAYRVIYDKKEQVKCIEDIIMTCFGAYEQSEKTSENEEKIVSFVRGILKDLQFLFKHECYASEQEFRFVFYLPMERPADLSEKIKMPEVLYRKQDGILIPYIDIATDKCLSEVMISPYIGSDRAKASVEGYLKKHGYDKCNVTLSKLPVRK